MDLKQQEQDANAIWEELDREDRGEKSPEPERVAEPEPKPAAEESPAKADDAPAQETAEDPYAGWPQAAKDKLAGLESMVSQLQQRVRNTEGHIGGIKSQLGTQLQAAQDVRDAGGDAPTPKELRAAQADPEAFARLREDYPEFASAIDSFVSSKLSTLRPSGADPSVEQLKSEFAAQMKELQVEVHHPGWKQAIAAPEFAGWYQRQPREVQRLADSSEVVDAVRMLDLYAQYRNESAPAPTTPRHASAAAIPTGRGSGPKPISLDDMTPEQLWAYYDAQERDSARR